MTPRQRTALDALWLLAVVVFVLVASAAVRSGDPVELSFVGSIALLGIAACVLDRR